MPTAAVLAVGSISGALSGRSARRSASRAADAERDSQALALERTDEMAERARTDATNLFSSGQQNALRGFGAANDLLGESIPEQIRTFQSGNMGAQDQIRAGAQQQQNAILGGPIDYSAFQTRQIAPPSASIFQRDMPQFESIQDALNPPTSNIEGLGGLLGFGPQEPYRGVPDGSLNPNLLTPTNHGFGNLLIPNAGNTSGNYFNFGGTPFGGTKPQGGY